MSLRLCCSIRSVAHYTCRSKILCLKTGNPVKIRIEYHSNITVESYILRSHSDNVAQSGVLLITRVAHSEDVWRMQFKGSVCYKKTTRWDQHPHRDDNVTSRWARLTSPPSPKTLCQQKPIILTKQGLISMVRCYQNYGTKGILLIKLTEVPAASRNP